MSGAKQKGAKGAMLGQCQAPFVRPFGVAMSLELQALCFFQA